MASARPSATTTMTTSSTNELPADFSLLAPPAAGLIYDCSESASASAGASAAASATRVSASSRHASASTTTSSAVTPSASTAPSVGGRLGLELGGGIVKQTCLHDLLRADVAALAHAGGLADAVAEVVELRATDVTAGGDLDLLDLRRVHGERALHADAEGLLADREGLARTVALALDHHALEDLRTATRAFDDLEVDADAIARLEAGDAAQLGALKAFDDSAHGKEKARRSAPRVGWVMVAKEAKTRPQGSLRGGRLARRARSRGRRSSAIARAGRVRPYSHGAEGIRPTAAWRFLRHRPERVRSPTLARLVGLGVRWPCRRPDHPTLVAAHAPPGVDLLVVARQQHRRDLPAAVLGRAGVVRVLGVAAQRLR